MPTIVLYCIVVCCFASHLPEERHTWGWPTFISIVRSRFMTQYAIDTCCAKWISRKSQLLHLTCFWFANEVLFGFLPYCWHRTQLNSDSTEGLHRKTFKRPPTCLKPRVERSGANWWWCQCTREVHQSESVVGSQSLHQQHLVLLFFTLLPFYFSAEQSNFIPASAIFWNPLSSRQTQLRWWWECLLWRVRTIWQSDNLTIWGQ